jgi:copper chaperone
MHPFTLSVPDMSCGHCRASIEKALLPAGAQLEFDMATRAVRVLAGPTPAEACATLGAIGFAATAAEGA